MNLLRVCFVSIVSVSIVLFVASCRNTNDQAPSIWSDADAFATGEVLLRIGTLDTLEGHVLHLVKGALWTPERQLAVANASSSEIRVFDSIGRLDRTWGRTGSGPNEFRSLAGLWLYGTDTIIAYDVGLKKLSLALLRNGETVREIPLSSESHDLWGRFRGLTFLEVRIANAPTSSREPGTLSMDTLAFRSLNVERGSSRAMGLFPWRTKYWVRLPSGQLIQTPLPLHDGSVFATGNDVFHVAHTDDGRIETYDMDGNLLTTINTGWGERPFTRAHKEAWVDDVIMTFPRSEHREARRYLQELPAPASLPAIDQLIVDDAGRLWVRRFPEPGTPSAEWAVYNPEGRSLGIGHLPTTSKLMHVGADFIVYLSPGSRDEDVLTVQVLTWGS